MGGAAPEEFTDHLLAEHWHCTPGQAREEDENDRALAIELLTQRAQYRKDQEFFNRP